MKSERWVFAVVAAQVLAGALSVSADEAPPAAPAAPVAPTDCRACHKPISSRKYVHGPVGVAMCSVCHVDEKPAADAAKRHSFSLAKPEPELCLSCHDGLREKMRNAKVLHGAITAGGCTACHDPHGSAQKLFLKGKNMAGLCASCHEDKLKGAVDHKPAAASCALCHDPHGAQNAKLLLTPAPELCFSCHQKMRSELSAKYLHGPVQSGCGTCHNPHSAPKARLLKVDGRKELCLGCHDDIAKQLKTVKRPHPAIESAGCIGCHSPHASPQAALLKAPMKELCSGCHEEKKQELKRSFSHGPVAANQCQGCHNAHGADNPNILKTFFPPEFYNSYKEGLYALCFNCHEKAIAREPKTSTLTNFRDGERNLHYVHVHSEKGRSCKACHQVHASNQQKHVREEVPFGSWMLPINYKKTASGGTCIVGCHSPKSYDRQQGGDR